MTQETTTGTEAATTTEGEATSTTAATESATAAEAGGQTAATTTEATEATTTEATTEVAKPQGAPEKYEFTAPEGREFNPGVLEAFESAVRELDMPQESAQKVLDKVAPALAAKQEQALAEARTKWGADTRADAELGGVNAAENIALANKAFTQFGTPELRTLLDTTGLGDHPEVLRWAHRVGKAISEDGFVAGKGGNVRSDPAKTMFPSMA